MNPFSCCHPAVMFIFYGAVCAFSMFMRNPVCACVSLVFSVVTSAVLCPDKLRRNALSYMLLFIVMAVINPVFNHRGNTALMYINDNPITLEACVYGVFTAMTVLSVFLWMLSFSHVMSSDRLMWLFGSFSPKLGSLICIAMRFIPLYIKRIRRTVELSHCTEQSGIRERISSYLRAFSIVTTRALEDSVEAADSMNARGYGAEKRTSFSPFVFGSRDALLCVAVIIPCVLVIACAVLGASGYSFYPSLEQPDFSSASWLLYISFSVLCALPFLTEMWERIKWRLLLSRA